VLGGGYWASGSRFWADQICGGRQIAQQGSANESDAQSNWYCTHGAAPLFVENEVTRAHLTGISLNDHAGSYLDRGDPPPIFNLSGGQRHCGRARCIAREDDGCGSRAVSRGSAPVSLRITRFSRRFGSL